MAQQPGAQHACGQRREPTLQRMPGAATAAHTYRWRAAHGAQTRRKTSAPLVPPKPKLFFTATSIFIARAWLAQ